MTKKNKAFLFDLNGTMIDDMEYHLEVWHDILNNELGVTLSRQEVRSHMYGKNHELLDRIFGTGKFTEAEVNAISQRKEERYQALYRPKLQLLPGLAVFLEKARQHAIPMAIGSAAIPFNIDFVINNLKLRHYFNTVVSAVDVNKSKPDPETFMKAASLLGVDPASCIVFEDAPKGVEAASNAGMQSVVLTTMHSPDEFSRYGNILFFAKDYTDAKVLALLGSQQPVAGV